MDAVVGDSFQVSISDGGYPRYKDVFVVSPAPNPLAGMWTQREAPSCNPGGELVGELIFRRRGLYMLTYRPFESRIDQMGSYTYDAASERLVMRTEARVRGEGTAQVVGDSLILRGDFEFAGGFLPPSCRVVFMRFAERGI
jgi:hypothetical protein